MSANKNESQTNSAKPFMFDNWIEFENWKGQLNLSEANKIKQRLQRESQELNRDRKQTQKPSDIPDLS